MKILYLTPGCFDKGGISRYSRYQIRALREVVGYDQLKALSLLGPDNEAIEESFEVDWAGSGISTVQKIAFTLRAAWLCLTWRPDAIHVAHINFSGMAKVLSWLCGAKTVLNIYGLEIWSGLSADASWGIQKMDTVMSDCHFTAEYAKQAGLWDKGEIKVIWDCVDFSKFSPAPWRDDILKKYNIPNPDQYFNVLTLGRLAKSAMHKGYDRLIEVIGVLAPRYPNLRLIVAGRGDNRPELERLAQVHGISSQTVFTGPVDEADLAEVYRTAHVFSLVSDRGAGRGEGIPLTPLEAMSCGAAVIVGNHDGSQEAIQDNDLNGFVIDPFDLETHARRIAEFIENSDMLANKRAGAWEVARRYFSYEHFREKHRQLYQSI